MKGIEMNKSKYKNGKIEFLVVYQKSLFHFLCLIDSIEKLEDQYL
jgi:hypothetical protein